MLKRIRRQLPRLWRAAVLCALAWIGYELHQIRRSIPDGMSWETESHIKAIHDMLHDISRQRR